MKVPVTVQGVTVHSRDGNLVELYLGERWLGNAAFQENTIRPLSMSSPCNQFSDLFSQIALALAVAPEAEWTIRTFSPNDHRYTFGERAYATELEARAVFERAVKANELHGGGSELRFKGVKVERHSAFARSS